MGGGADEDMAQGDGGGAFADFVERKPMSDIEFVGGIDRNYLTGF